MGRSSRNKNKLSKKILKTCTEEYDEQTVLMYEETHPIVKDFVISRWVCGKDQSGRWIGVYEERELPDEFLDTDSDLTPEEYQRLENVSGTGEYLNVKLTKSARIYSLEEIPVYEAELIRMGFVKADKKISVLNKKGEKLM